MRVAAAAPVVRLSLGLLLRLRDGGGLARPPGVISGPASAEVLAGAPGGVSLSWRLRGDGEGWVRCRRGLRSAHRSICHKGRCRCVRSGGPSRYGVLRARLRGPGELLDGALPPAGHAAHRGDLRLAALPCVLTGSRARWAGGCMRSGARGRRRDRRGRLGHGPLRVVLLLGGDRDVREGGDTRRGRRAGSSAGLGALGMGVTAGAASGAGGVGGVRRRCRLRGRCGAGLHLSELASDFGSTFRLATLASTHGLRGHAGSLQVAGVMGKSLLPAIRW